MKRRDQMTPKLWRDALERLGISHIEFAAHLRRDLRTVRRWIAGTHTTPREVATLLRLLCAGKLKLEDLKWKPD